MAWTHRTGSSQPGKLTAEVKLREELGKEAPQSFRWWQTFRKGILRSLVSSGLDREMAFDAAQVPFTVLQGGSMCRPWVLSATGGVGVRECGKVTKLLPTVVLLLWKFANYCDHQPFQEMQAVSLHGRSLPLCTTRLPSLGLNTVPPFCLHTSGFFLCHTRGREFMPLVGTGDGNALWLS